MNALPTNWTTAKSMKIGRDRLFVRKRGKIMLPYLMRNAKTERFRLVVMIS